MSIFILKYKSLVFIFFPRSQFTYHKTFMASCGQLLTLLNAISRIRLLISCNYYFYGDRYDYQLHISTVCFSSTEERMKVKIKSWTAVGTWQWVSNDDTCGICRMSFEACCPDCRTPGDDCPLVWGECTHCFHIHCIVKWLSSQPQQQQCPMCRQDWKFKE